MLTFLSPLHKATRQIGVWFEERMTGFGISPQEGHLISYLRSYAPCPISEVVRVFGLKNSTMTSLLDRLESLGLVERLNNPDDRRSFLVRLTRRGRSLADRVQTLVDVIEKEIGDRVSERELRGFEVVMSAVADATKVTLRERE